MEEAVKNIEPSYDAQFSELVEGLKARQKSIPSKFFYDEKGSKLFDLITELPEYYPTRTELKILKNNLDEILSVFPEGSSFIEFGSGSSVKTKALLDNLKNLAAYVPIDISEDHLLKTAEDLRSRYPGLRVVPVAADYTNGLIIPEIDGERFRVGFFPGSTVGNFSKEGARKFLQEAASICGKGNLFIIGVDLVKDPAVLEAAYNDSQGVTAEFNLNILDHLNREYGFDFDKEKFEHLAFWNAEESRIEMHLKSLENQKAAAYGEEFSFSKGETIRTEFSHKYTPEAFRSLCSDIFRVKKIWTDDNDYFSLQLLEVI